ncbi:hypothetical protein [Actinoallomurus sp. NPDC052274]|uniref:hypothetical protein n=1 Tax=Actinoallomurus sp. NPDC052274 TaxID=3155420 RepID=UPI00342F5BC1
MPSLAEAKDHTLPYQHATSERDKRIADGLNLVIERTLTLPAPESTDGLSGNPPGGLIWRELGTNAQEDRSKIEGPGPGLPVYLGLFAWSG